jgi:hypothetical protein
MYEPELTRAELLEEHPMTWIVQVNGILIDTRALPPELQDEARRRGRSPIFGHDTPHSERLPPTRHAQTTLPLIAMRQRGRGVPD